MNLNTRPIKNVPSAEFKHGYWLLLWGAFLLRIFCSNLVKIFDRQQQALSVILLKVHWTSTTDEKQLMSKLSCDENSCRIYRCFLNNGRFWWLLFLINILHEKKIKRIWMNEWLYLKPFFRPYTYIYNNKQTKLCNNRLSNNKTLPDKICHCYYIYFRRRLQSSKKGLTTIHPKKAPS